MRLACKSNTTDLLALYFAPMASHCTFLSLFHRKNFHSQQIESAGDWSNNESGYLCYTLSIKDPIQYVHTIWCGRCLFSVIVYEFKE